MTLKKFIKDQKEEEILNNEKVNIKATDDTITFQFKDIKTMSEYEPFLFCAPTEAIIGESEKDLEEFYEKAIKAGVEGVMVKSLEAFYKPGLRVGAMCKLKPYQEDLDLVIIAGEYGKGKRGGLISSFIVAVKSGDRFLEIGKVGSGIKEDESEVSVYKLNKLLQHLKIRETSNRVEYEPKVVIQVRFQEILKSPKYSSGYALRFPRIITLRTDKPPEEATTLEEVRNIIGN